MKVAVIGSRDLHVDPTQPSAGPAPALPTPGFGSMELSERFLWTVSGLSDVDLRLLDAHGGRWAHGGIAAAVGVTAVVATWGVLVPKSLYASGAFLALATCAVVFAGAEIAALALLLALAALGALAVLFHILLSAKPGTALPAAVAFVLASAPFYATARAVRARRRRTLGLDVLARLRASAFDFNKLVRSLEVKDRLVAAQAAPADTTARTRVIADLTTARANLVRTLEVERILRENRSLLEEVGDASVDFAPLEAARLHGEANDYARVIQQTAELAVDVEAAFAGLDRHSAERLPPS